MSEIVLKLDLFWQWAIGIIIVSHFIKMALDLKLIILYRKIIKLKAPK